jgi:hypothetical protein
MITRRGNFYGTSNRRYWCRIAKRRVRLAPAQRKSGKGAARQVPPYYGRNFGKCPFKRIAGPPDDFSGQDRGSNLVPKLQEGINFFTKVLGCEYIYTAGPFSDPKGDWMKTNLDVDPRAVTTLAMVRCGPSQSIELFEYEAGPSVRFR